MKGYFKKNRMKIANIKDVFFDLDHTLWDFDKNSELTFEVIFKRIHPTIEISAFIEKYVPINQAFWKLYQYDKITHEELRYNRLKQSFSLKKSGIPILVIIFKPSPILKWQE